MAIRFNKGGAYQSDIRALRNLVRTNGTQANILPVTLSHPGTAVRATLYLSMAYQPNEHLTVIPGSLYTVAFATAAGVRNFVLPGVPVPATAQPLAGNPAGSYASLGFNQQVPSISNQSLLDAIIAVSQYAGGPIPANVQTGMARLIIAVSEAVRFDAVAAGVDTVLGSTATYQPDADQLRNWGGHFIGS
jgi:hypothetical protein